MKCQKVQKLKARWYQAEVWSMTLKPSWVRFSLTEEGLKHTLHLGLTP